MQPQPTPLSHTSGGLTALERSWRDQYVWLLEQGYQLRSRYSPDWVPSWISLKKPKYFDDYEDGAPLLFGQVLDAIRIRDKKPVALKSVLTKANPLEEEIMRFLCSEELAGDPQNYCSPLLDVLRPPGLENEIILVLPLLRQFDSPAFDTIGEGMQCFRQLFEGLQFMHKHQVAHRDIGFMNLMMDCAGMYPRGYHFVEKEMKPDMSGRAPFFTRTQRPPRYYLIDFGLSQRYDTSIAEASDFPVLGGDKTVPEFLKFNGKPHNPFKTDIYYAGNLIRQTITVGHPVLVWIRGYTGFEFMNPLIDDMVQDDPDKRPTIDEVVERFNDILNQLSSSKLRSRPIPRRENPFLRVVRNAGHLRRKIWFTLSRTPAIPSRPSL